MEFETDESQSKYSYEYLMDCREKFMRKVAVYRERIEKLSAESTRVACKHRQEIEHIRSFYQAIAYAPTRSGKMVKAARCSSNVAAEIMQELGLEYRNI